MINAEYDVEIEGAQGTPAQLLKLLLLNSNAAKFAADSLKLAVSQRPELQQKRSGKLLQHLQSLTD